MVAADADCELAPRRGDDDPEMCQCVEMRVGAHMGMLGSENGGDDAAADSDKELSDLCAVAIISRAVAMSDNTEPAVHIEPPSVPHVPAAEHVLRNVFRHLFTGKDVQGVSADFPLQNRAPNMIASCQSAAQ